MLVGGGPTGVEMAGSIAELARSALRAGFPPYRPGRRRASCWWRPGRGCSHGFADRLSAYALRRLRAMHVDVRLGTAIQDIDARGAVAPGGRIDAGLVIWCAGVRGTGAARWLGHRADAPGHRAGRARSLGAGPSRGVRHRRPRRGRHAGRAPPAASGAGRQAAGEIRGGGGGGAGGGPPAPPAFAYRDPGALAIVGRSAAVVDFGWLRLTGFAGWLVWGLAHIFFLIGFRSRIAVFLSWAWEWLTYKRGARLIVDRRES